MNTIKIEKKGVQLVAHRGCSGLEQENTHAAFVAAGNRSYFGIECDVHRTVDGKYVIIHDDTTARVAIDSLVVEESTYDTLRNLLLKEKNGEKGRTDIRIPSLQEYISICKHYDKIAVLELKNHFEKEDVWEICSIIEEMGYMENVIFISFDYENMVTLREKYPNQPAQFLDYKGEADLVDRLKAHNLDLDISHKVLTKELIDACHAEGIKVNCWTVDDVEIANRLIDWGVDFITTNILE
jgi:glycerophosphoryl diester phosphodiesterase